MATNEIPVTDVKKDKLTLEQFIEANKSIDVPAKDILNDRMYSLALAMLKIEYATYYNKYDAERK